MKWFLIQLISSEIGASASLKPIRYAVLNKEYLSCYLRVAVVENTERCRAFAIKANLLDSDLAEQNAA